MSSAPTATVIVVDGVDAGADSNAAASDLFRMRSLDGLAIAINERCYRASTVADIVRHARTSKRAFYDHFASKEECLLELLANDLETLGASIVAVVDPEADWQQQIRQACDAVIDPKPAQREHRRG